MKSSDKRALARLQPLLAKGSFAEDIKSMRHKFGIPSEGFTDAKSCIHWMEDMHEYIFIRNENKTLKSMGAEPISLDERKYLPGLESECHWILEKYNQPPSMGPIIMRYMLHSNKLNHEYLINPGCEIADNIEETTPAIPNGIFSESLPSLNKEKKHKSIYIRIQEGVSSATQVKDFIDENWPLIRKRLGRDHIQRSRLRHKFDLHHYIYGLSKKRKSDLKKMVDEFGGIATNNKYKLISDIVWFKQHKRLLSSNISMIISRLRYREKNNK